MQVCLFLGLLILDYLLNNSAKQICGRSRWVKVIYCKQGAKVIYAVYSLTWQLGSCLLTPVPVIAGGCACLPCGIISSGFIFTCFLCRIGTEGKISK